MLDALSDFWKPNKKSSQESLRAEQLQIGSALVFGFVPQGSLSGRRMQISVINTYQFGSESLTSFVLSQDKDPGVSMIVAESEGEQYLAISRRITVSDRIKMFDSKQLEDVMEKPDVSQLTCKENSDFKGWTVTTYRREIQGMKGYVFAGDFRKASLPAPSTGQEFKYTLLASESNEHAIEIEKYGDGRIEIYATVYRRVSDIGEVSPPSRPDLKLASSQPEEKPAVIAEKSPSLPFKSAAPIKLPELTPSASAPKPEAVSPLTAKPAVSETPVSVPKPAIQEKAMPQPATAENRPFSPNGGGAPKLSSVVVQPAPESPKQEVKAVSKLMNGLDNENVECDLRIANKIIDEAIRNEMRLSDVVRRIIELPVANQESVQIPVTLSDEDYALLAIRYGISSSDRNAIKTRIIDDLNSFSGKKAA